MTTIDLTPLYSSSVGFDRLASILDKALDANKSPAGYPPYDIEVAAENNYAITLAVAGFDKKEIDLQVENGVLTIRGKKEKKTNGQKFLYQGISSRNFECKFNLADYIEVTGAEMNNGLLTINLVKEIPEAMKPRKIAISDSAKTLEHHSDDEKAA